METFILTKFNYRTVLEVSYCKRKRCRNEFIHNL